MDIRQRPGPCAIVPGYPRLLAMFQSPRASRAIAGGFTLTEVMIVLVLAGIVMIGLSIFYLNSQMTWTDASTQALAQRDATTLIEYMREYGQGAAEVDASDSTVAIFFNRSNVEIIRFRWDPFDSLVYYGVGPTDDRGPVVPTRVESFVASKIENPRMLNLALRVRSSSGQGVTMTSTIGLYNQ